jgi:hypothetical protein
VVVDQPEAADTAERSFLRGLAAALQFLPGLPGHHLSVEPPNRSPSPDQIWGGLVVGNRDRHASFSRVVIIKNIKEGDAL